ncbi:MAG: pyridoxal phosphate-dependent aminotransferase [Planctomycetota bacterium]
MHETPRFPTNGITELMELDRTHNLSESTSQDLSLREAIGEDAVAELLDLKLGYGSLEGLEPLRHMLAADRGVKPGQVLTVHGAILALHLVAMELCRSGEDEVVVLAPTFPATQDTLHAAGAKVIPCRTKFENGYALSIEDVMCRVTDRTRLVSLATPQNPSGKSITTDEIESLLEALAERAPEAYVLVDETYRDATFDGVIPPSAAPLDGRVITCGSISKAYGVPALRLGWLTTTDAELYERLRIAKMNTVISESLLCEHIAVRVLERKDEILAAQREVLNKAIAAIEAWLPSVGHLIEWVKPDGGALCVMRLKPDAFSDDLVTAFFDRQAAFDLQVSRGEWFGDESRVIRIGFGHVDPEKLPAALEALGRALKAVSGTEAAAAVSAK